MQKWPYLLAEEANIASGAPIDGMEDSEFVEVSLTFYFVLVIPFLRNWNFFSCEKGRKKKPIRGVALFFLMSVKVEVKFFFCFSQTEKVQTVLIPQHS